MKFKYFSLQQHDWCMPYKKISYLCAHLELFCLYLWCVLVLIIDPLYMFESEKYPILDPFQKYKIWKLILLLFWIWRSNHIIILHISWQLCCHGMCKIVTWSDHYLSSQTHLKIWVMCSKPYRIMGPICLCTHLGPRWALCCSKVIRVISLTMLCL